MNLTVVIAIKLLVKDLLSVLDFGHIFADTGSDQAVLEPPIRSFDFAFGLGRKSMGDVNVTVL